MKHQKTPVLIARTATLAASLAAMALPAFAQPATPPTLADVDQAFREVFANPASLDLRFKYARLLVQSGNYEGGVAALEDLVDSPNAPANIHLELGILYYRMASYAAAEAHLRKSLTNDTLDAQQRDLAESVLRDVTKRNQVSRLSGKVVLGVRTQTNPTNSTDSGTVLYQGLGVPRGDYGPKSDTDVHVWAVLDHSFDLEQQNEAAITTNLFGYANHYGSVSSYNNQPGSNKPFDLTIVAGNVGVNFLPLPNSDRNWSLRPHLIFGGASANGSSYFTTGGWGIGTDYRVSERLSYGGGFASTRLSYPERADMPGTPAQGGSRQSLRLNASAETAPGRFLLTEFWLVDHDGNAPYTGYRSPELRLSYVLNWASPFSGNALPWTTTITGSAARREYRSPDPLVSPLTARQDTEWRLGVFNEMPVSRDTSVQFQLEYANVNSNIPNYSSTNTSATLGVHWKY